MHLTCIRQSCRYEVNAPSSLNGRKSRSCLITLILVIVIIAVLSIAGLVIAIYTLALNASKSEVVTISTSSSTEPTSTTGMQNQFFCSLSFNIMIVADANLICTNSPVTSYQYSTAAPAQCYNYTNNSDPTRNIVYTQTISYCDNISPFKNNTSVWIRFLDPAGKVIINAAESPNRCGTVATGWYAGQYPIAYYTTATSIVCFFYTSNTCAACSRISITNCRDFFVFLLPKPDSCNFRYCTI